MVVFDPNSQQYVNVPDPRQIRVPFLNRQMGAGDIVRQMTQTIGIQACPPCEERQRRLNQRLRFVPWDA